MGQTIKLLSTGSNRNSAKRQTLFRLYYDIRLFMLVTAVGTSLALNETRGASPAVSGLLRRSQQVITYRQNRVL